MKLPTIKITEEDRQRQIEKMVDNLKRDALKTIKHSGLVFFRKA